MSPGDEHDGYGGSGQTRTRLPEGNTGDVHGGTRRPARGSRSLLTGVGVVVLLVAAIAFANRGGGDPAGSSPSSGTPGKTGATAPTGTRPVTGTDGTVPTGYAHDEQGAQSAAANYATALGSTDMYQKGPREALIRAVYAPAVVDDLLKRLDDSYSPALMASAGLEPNGTAPTGLTFVARTVPIGTKVTGYSSDKATVEVWYVNLTGLAGEGSTKPVTSAWFTSTQNLTWTAQGWRLTSTSEHEGPTPVNGDSRASVAEEIAEAVEQYGGFTYAR
ncbi:hypothetical protein ACFWIN_28705 [Streptomyces sp. NPDC127049]|uniref:hypothetical protein n=1 Tax=unclassified Streptomyces TaxID=2593676 RepID=UPI00364B6992